MRKALFAALLIVGSGASKMQAQPIMGIPLNVACNTDGTYTCVQNCSQAEARWCC